MKQLQLLISIVGLFACFSFSNAQQPQPASTGTGLVLEVQYLRGRRPAYQAVPRPQNKKWVWYGLFGHIPDWQLPAGALPVNAVRVTPWQENETVNINVSVLRGKFLDVEDSVGSYTAREGETITVTELTNFGVEPFVIKIARTAHTETNPPSFLNKTGSLEVVSIEPVLSNFPAFKLTLRNHSDKDIAALSVMITKNGKPQLSGMPKGPEGEPLIKAGSSTELRQPLPVRAVPTAAGYQPALPAQLEFVIEALVFTDGSYEGDVAMAAKYRAFVCGNKSELSRLVPALEAAQHETDSDPVNGLAQLRSQIQSLSTDIDESDFRALEQTFPTVDRKALRISVAVATHATKKMLLDDLERFEHRRSQPAVTFLSWLSATKDRYAAWLSRL